MISEQFDGCRYLLASSETGNIIDGGNDLAIMLTYLRRFRRTNMSLFDRQDELHIEEYWYDEGRKLNKAPLVV